MRYFQKNLVRGAAVFSCYKVGFCLLATRTTMADFSTRLIFVSEFGKIKNKMSLEGWKLRSRATIVRP